MKHKDEWETLVNIGVKKGLLEDQIILLIALRELEDGTKGYEYNLVIAKDTSLEIQAEFVANLIKTDTRRYGEYLRAPCTQSTMSFIEFFISIGGPLGHGWADEKAFIEKLGDKVEQVKKEIYKKWI